MTRIVLLGKMASWCEPEIRTRIKGPFEMLAIPEGPVTDEHWTAVEQADILVGWPVTTAVAERAHNLKFVQVSGAGIDGLALDALPPHVRVANTYHHEAAIAEYVLMAMLWLSRRPAEHHDRLRNGVWDGSCIWGETPYLMELYGRQLLLIGLGHIAREVAQRANAFGMHVVGASRRPDAAEGLYSKIVHWDHWRDELPEADFIVPTCPLAPETVGLIGAREYSLMKSTAHVVNITRGRVFDEEALYEALKTKRIAGAAIDVWYQYPTDPAEPKPPSRFPFHELDNIMMSPHNSGWTRRCIMGRVEDIADNINRLAEGRELRNVVR